MRATGRLPHPQWRCTGRGDRHVGCV